MAKRKVMISEKHIIRCYFKMKKRNNLLNGGFNYDRFKK
jgi:hypothetical protein